MTPKEKAKDLYYKFAPFTHGRRGYQITHAIMAKKAALAACNEVLDLVEAEIKEPVLREYWSEVKKEVENL